MLIGKGTVIGIHDIPFVFHGSTYCLHSPAAAEEGDLHFKRSKLELSRLVKKTLGLIGTSTYTKDGELEAL